MAKSYVVDGTEYRFPDEMNDQQVHDVLLKQGVIKPPPAQHWSDTMGLQNPVARGVTDFAEGTVSGAASTVFHGGDMIRRALGMDRVINRPEVQQAITPPPSMAGKAGKFVEQGAEFMIPGGIAAKAGKALDLGLAGRMALEGAAAGGTTAVQTGGDPTATALGTVAGAAGPAVGEALPAAGKWLGDSAKAQYGRVLNPTTKANKFLAKQSVPRLLDEGVMARSMGTLKDKTSAQVAKYGEMIGDEWDKLPAGTTVDAEPVLQRIGQQATEAHTIAGPNGRVPIGPEAERALANTKALGETLKAIATPNPETGVLEIPADKLRQVRQYFDTVAAKAGRYQGKDLADASAAEAHGMAADAIREQLAQKFPSIDAINQDYTFWKNVNKVVSDTVDRRTGQAKPLSQKMAGAAGAVGGFGGGGIHGAVMGKAALETLATVTNSAAWGTVSAVMKDRLAKAIASGNRGEAEFLVAKIAKAATEATISTSAQ